MIDTDGKIFSAREKKMEQIEFQGKRYEATENLSLAVIHEGRPCEDEFSNAVKIFGGTYGYAGVIPATQENFDKLTINMQRYLVQNSHLKEAVEEETYKVNQWFTLGGIRNCLYTIVGECLGDKYMIILYDTEDHEFRMVDGGHKKSLTETTRYLKGCCPTLIPPPTITEQPEIPEINVGKAERYPDKCIYNKNRNCISPSHPPGWTCGKIGREKGWPVHKCREYTEE